MAHFACFPVAMLQPPITEPSVSDHLTLFLASLGQRELEESEVSFGSCLRRFIPEHRSSCQTRREIQGVCCR